MKIKEIRGKREGKRGNRRREGKRKKGGREKPQKIVS